MDRYPQLKRLEGWNINTLVLIKQMVDRGVEYTEDDINYLTIVGTCYADFRECIWMYNHLPKDSPHVGSKLSGLKNLYSRLTNLTADNVKGRLALQEMLKKFQDEISKVPKVNLAIKAEKEKGDSGNLRASDEEIRTYFPGFQPTDLVALEIISGRTLSVPTMELLNSIEDDEVVVDKPASENASSESTGSSTTVIDSNPASNEDVDMDRLESGSSSLKNTKNKNRSGPYAKPSPNKGKSTKTGSGLTPENPTSSNVSGVTPVTMPPVGEESLVQLLQEAEYTVKMTTESLEETQKAMLEQQKEKERLARELQVLRDQYNQIQIRPPVDVQTPGPSFESYPVTDPANKRQKTEGMQRDVPRFSTLIEPVDNSPPRKPSKHSNIDQESSVPSEKEIDELFDVKKIFGEPMKLSTMMAESFRGVNNTLFKQLKEQSSSKPADGKKKQPSLSTAAGMLNLSQLGNIADDRLIRIDDGDDPLPGSYGSDGVQNDTRLNKLDGAVTYSNWLSSSMNLRLGLFANFFSRYLRTTASADFGRPVYHNFQTAIAIQFLNTGKIKSMAPDMITDVNLRDALTCVEIFMPKVPLSLYWQERPARRHCHRYLNEIMSTNLNVLPNQFYSFLDSIVSTTASPVTRIENIRTELRRLQITSRELLVQKGSGYIEEDIPEDIPENRAEIDRILRSRREFDAVVDMKFGILMEFIEHALETFRNDFIKLWTSVISKSFLMICRRGAVTTHQINRFTTALNAINPNGYSQTDYSPELMATMYNDVKNYICENTALIFFNRISSYLGQRYSPVISNYASYTRMSGMSALVIINTAITKFADFPWYLARSYFRAAYGAYETALRALWNRPYAGYNPNGIDPKFAARNYMDLTYLCIELQKKFGGSAAATIIHYKGVNRRLISDMVKTQVSELLKIYEDRVLIKHTVNAVSIDERRAEFVASERMNYILARANLELVDSLTNGEGEIADPSQLDTIALNCQFRSSQIAKQVYRTDLKQIRPASVSTSPLEEMLRQLISNNNNNSNTEDAPQGYI